MAITGVLLVSTIFCLIVNLSDGKQLIRLQKGMECPMPGYYRDVQNCRKFYYCPGPHFSEQPLLSQHEDEFVKFLGTGLMCPDGSIYDESIDACNELGMVKAIPPECHASSKQPASSVSSPTNSGTVNEIITNN